MEQHRSHVPCPAPQTAGGAKQLGDRKAAPAFYLDLDSGWVGTLISLMCRRSQPSTIEPCHRGI